MLRFITQKFRNQSINEVEPGFEWHQSWGPTNDEYIRVKKDEALVHSTDAKEVCLDTKMKDNFNETESIGHSNHNVNYQNGCNHDNLVFPILQKPNKDDDKENCYFCKRCKRWKTFSIPDTFLHCLCKTTDQVASFHQGEKRKHSNSIKSKLKLPNISNNSDSSSDDEIKDLCAKYKCINPNQPKSSNSKQTVVFRNQQQFICINPVRSRPSLNFEKMQQKPIKRQRPRVLKVMRVEPLHKKCSEVMTFRPIQLVAAGGISTNVPIDEPIQKLQSGFVF